MGELSRMTQFKDKSLNLTKANGTTSIPVGLFMYPILMAADILLYDVDYVVVGIDQKQHLELTNDIAIRMNKKYGELFKIAEPMIDKNTSKIMDLKNPLIKMSKSNSDTLGTIFLLDSIDDVTKKIMSAKTDSLNKVKFDIVNQPGVSNLLTIYSALTNCSIDEAQNKFKDKDYGVFKKELVKILTEFLVQFQTKYNDQLKNFDKIERNIIETSHECLTLTNKKLQNIKQKIGLL
jgi:tryptophanyl-tRNA synthetase